MAPIPVENIGLDTCHTDGAIRQGQQDVVPSITGMKREKTNHAEEAGKEHNIEASQGPQVGPEHVKKRSRLRLFVTLLAIYLCTFLAALDETIVATAIPTIASDLHSAAGYTWIGGTYLLAKAASTPIWAKISDIWGRKPVFLCAVFSFAATSVICAVSTSMTMLIVGRACQGTAAGGLIQLVNITVSDLFSMRERALYLGLVEVMWALAGGIGPVLGGAFTQLASWRWAFWINLPLSGITFALLVIFLDVHNPRTPMLEGLKAVDWFGSFSILGFTIMLLLGLDFGGVTFPWDSSTVICLVIFGGLMSILFIFSEKKLARYPLMPLSLFTKSSAAASLVVDFAHGLVFLAVEYYLPLYFQSAQSASPLRSGVLLVPFIVAEAVMGIAVGIIIHRTGRYQELIWIGLLLLTLGNGLFVRFNAFSSTVQIVIFQLIAGTGAGMLFEPPLIAIQALVSQDDTATTTSTFGFVRNLAASCSVVIGGVIFQNGMDLQATNLRRAGLSTDLSREFSGRFAAANVMRISTIEDPMQKMVVKQAFAWSLRNLWIMTTCISAGGIIASAFIRKDFLSKEHTETITGLRKEKEEQNPVPNA